MRPVLIRQHGETGPPGVLAEWLRAREIPWQIDASWLGRPAPGPEAYEFVVSLGSKHSPRDVHEPSVAAELRLLERAVECDVPVLGLCFGGQALAAVLGGAVAPAPRPELGWRTIDTDAPELVPAGPWLEWHFERFTTPPGGDELARTDDAVQAFRLGPHLGVQFHPESTVDIVAGWAAKDARRLRAVGIGDVTALLEAPPEQAEASRAAAFRLFDAFVQTRERV